MRQVIFGLLVLLLTLSLWAQARTPGQVENAAIRHGKSLIVSSLDRSLPNVSLEHFLEYESEGAPIKWRVSDCGEQTGNPVHDKEICIEAEFEIKQQTTVTILISVGTLSKRRSGVAAFIGGTITDTYGSSRPVRRLSDLPMELHRPLPKLPRDLPLPSGAMPTLSF